jgi:hypothetical protein
MLTLSFQVTKADLPPPWIFRGELKGREKDVQNMNTKN